MGPALSIPIFINGVALGSAATPLGIATIVGVGVAGGLVGNLEGTINESRSYSSHPNYSSSSGDGFSSSSTGSSSTSSEPPVSKPLTPPAWKRPLAHKKPVSRPKLHLNRYPPNERIVSAEAVSRPLDVRCPMGARHYGTKVTTVSGSTHILENNPGGPTVRPAPTMSSEKGWRTDHQVPVKVNTTVRELHEKHNVANGYVSSGLCGGHTANVQSHLAQDNTYRGALRNGLEMHQKYVGDI